MICITNSHGKVDTLIAVSRADSNRSRSRKLRFLVCLNFTDDIKASQNSTNKLDFNDRVFISPSSVIQHEIRIFSVLILTTA